MEVMTRTAHTPPLPLDSPAVVPGPVHPTRRRPRTRPVAVQQPSPCRQRLVVVSSRIVHHDDARSGGQAMTLRRVLRMHGGLWFGWSGAVVEQPALSLQQDARGGFDCAAFDLDPEDHEVLRNGFSERALRPLLQFRLNDMAYSRDDMAAWLRVNARLAARLKTLLQPGDLVWINGLHLLPMANELRALGVANRIGLFLHAALPPCNILSSMPRHEQVFGGLRACDLIGVQTARDANALRDYLIRFQSVAQDGDGRLRTDTRTLQLSSFPVGIDVERMADLAQRADARTLFRHFRHGQGSRKLLIGVDRPHHAKGLGQRLRALDHLLQQSPQLAGTFSMLQIAPPANCDTPLCRKLDRELDRQVSDINGHHAGPDWTPIRYLKRWFPQQMLAGFLRIADVGLMTPLHDGMSLLAKEYVAAQDPRDPGVLVLSQFSGAACELGDAVLVNPLDIENMAAGMHAALHMPLPERRARWKAMMAALHHYDLQHWSDDFLHALAGGSVIRISRTPS